MLPIIFVAFVFEYATASNVAHGNGWKATPWPDNVVYYTLPKDNKQFTTIELNEFQKAFKAIEENTCINFKEGQGKAGYVQVGRHTDFEKPSKVEVMGYGEGEQQKGAHKLWIQFDDKWRWNDKEGVGYANYNTIKHEFLHALGLQHEEFGLNHYGQGRPNWRMAYGKLNQLYNCPSDQKYPRQVTRTVECLDQDKRCPLSGCNQEYFLDNCDLTCGTCKSSSTQTQQEVDRPGPSPKPEVDSSVACQDQWNDCAPSPQKPLDWICGANSPYKGKCDKTCNKCQGSSNGGQSSQQQVNRPACFDQWNDCAPGPTNNYAPQSWICNDPTSKYYVYGKCDKTCNKCQGSSPQQVSGPACFDQWNDCAPGPTNNYAPQNWICNDPTSKYYVYGKCDKTCNKC